MARSTDGDTNYKGIKTGVTDDILGSMRNRELVRDTYVGGVAEGATITRGQLCYYDTTSGSEGWKPTGTNSVPRGRVRVAEDSVDNSDGDQGDKVVSTFGGGVIVVVQVGSTERSSTNQPLKAGDTFVSADGGKITSILFRGTSAEGANNRLGVVLGKVGEVDEHDIEAYGKDLVEGDYALVRFY